MDYGIYSYILVRIDRERQRAWLVAYVKDHLNFEAMQYESPFNKDEEIETMSFKLKLPNSKPMIFTCFYRPPHSSLVCFLSESPALLNTISTYCTELYILGDLNAVLLSDPRAKGLLQSFSNFNLLQVITEPTRVGLKSKPLLDHIYTNNIEYARQSGVIRLGLSDHDLIFI
jgi:hypothetical protein